MFILLKSFLRTLILPPGIFLILSAIGLLLIRRHRTLGATLVVAGLASLWLCATPVVADVLERIAERYPPLDLSHPVNAQAIVILAGGGVRTAPEYGGGLAAAGETLERLNYGAYVAHRTSLPVLVTGSPMEAAAMRATLARDLNVNVRWSESQSGDTFQNASFSARLLRPEGIQRIILVTSSEHEWRAAHEFMSAGLQVVPAPVGTLTSFKHNATSYVPSADGLEESYRAVYELIGDPVRRLFDALHLRRQPQN